MIMEKIKLNRISQQLMTFGIILCAFGAIFLTLIHTYFIEHHVAKKIVLKRGWSMRKAWIKYSYEFHAYIFNVTNPDEILAGAKPILKEFGPYVYDALEEKVDVQDHEEDDTLSYVVKRTYTFNAAKSNGLSDEDEYVLAHFLYLGIANSILRDKPTLLPLGSKSIDSLYNNPKSIFVNAKVKQYLFEGFELDCVGVEDFFGKVLCNDIKDSWFKYRMEKIREDFYTLSCMGTFNDTIAWARRARINRGLKNITAIGKLVEYDNAKNFAKWNDEKCDSFFDSTDGTMYHPYLTSEDNLYMANTDLNRRLAFQYDSDVVHNGLECFRFTTTVGTDLDTNPDDKCYCLAPDRCLKNGVFEVWKSMNLALVASNPHFCLADPYYLDTAVGFNPKKEKHLMTVDVHPLTGSAVHWSFRIQFNMPLTKQPKYRLLKNVPEAFLPAMWFEDKHTLSDGDIQLIKFFAVSAIVVGLLLVAVGAGLEYKERVKLNASK